MMSSWSRSPLSSPVTLPARKTSTRSHSTARSAASMEAMSTAQPPRAASRIASMMSCLAPTSTAWVGSRSTSRSGWPASHLPSTTFCWLPPLSVPTGADGSGGLMSSLAIMAAVSSACHARPVRNLADAGLDELLGGRATAGQGDLPAADGQLAGIRPPCSPGRLGHVLEAGAHQPGEADDLAVPDVQIQAGDLADRQGPDRAGDVVARVAVHPAVRDQVTAEHEPGEGRLVDVPGIQARLHDLAVPQHRDPVGRLDDP